MKRALITVLAIVVIVGGFILIRKDSTTPASIGAVLPLTGSLAFIGEDMKNGLEMAANEAGLRVEVSDGAADPQKSLNAARQLVDIKKVSAILTAFRGATLSIASALKDNPVVIGSITATAEGKRVSTSTPNLFVIGPEVIASAEVLGQYAKINSLCKTPAALVEQNDPVKDKVRGFTRGISGSSTALLTETFDPAATDWRTNIAKMKQAKADCLFIEVRSNSLPVLLRQFEENKYSPKIFTTSYSFTPAVIAVAPKNQLGNLIYSTTFLDRNGNGFFAKYKEMYGKDATDFAAMAYEFVRVMEKPIKDCTGEAACIRTKLSSIANLPSAAGELTMNENQEAQLKGYSLFQVIDGKLSEVK